MNTGITVKVKWFDDDLLELTITCSNLDFSGNVNVYLPRNGIREIIKVFTGFPNTLSDRRDITLGTMDPNYANGGVKLQLFCSKTGNPIIKAEMISETAKTIGDLESVSLSIPIEAASIDIFVEELNKLPIDIGNVVQLPMSINSK